MKCAKCGAELKKGCLYCSVCGHEAQIVSDYNVLEDDYLRSLLKDGEGEKNPQEKEPEPKKTKKKKKSHLALIVCLLSYHNRCGCWHCCKTLYR